MNRIFLFLSVLCLSSPAAAQPIYSDGVTQYASVQSQQWVNCAKEGKDCEPGTSDLVITRYGISEDFTFFITKGLEKVPCKNFWGDPSRGTDKECAYIRENLFGVPPDETFAKVADEGKDFSNPNGEYRWVRYGTGGQVGLNADRRVKQPEDRLRQRLFRVRSGQGQRQGLPDG